MTASASAFRTIGLPHVEELPPGLAPWEVAQRFAHWPNLLFLDSADRASARGRYSYVMAAPTEQVSPFSPGFSPLRARTVPGLPPFQGGYAGLLSYELGKQFEKTPRNQWDEFPVSERLIFRYDWVIAFDHQENRSWLIAHGEDAEKQLRLVRETLKSPVREWPAYKPASSPSEIAPQFPLGIANVSSNFSREGYLIAVQRAVDYIHAGDCFQINLSQRLLAPLQEHALKLYDRLRSKNAAPFAAYFDAGDWQILSASPERFLQVTPEREIITRPIKGTRPRGQTAEADRSLISELLSNPKDRAENVMIVDLLRNDIGRVAEFGSVTVPKVCELESFRFVHHLVSEVRGKLRADCTIWDLMRAAFPGGSVTGAPKVRSMEIIAELEPTARGAYCGSLGFWGFDGTVDTNILIRTFTASKGYLQFPVGGGIVADSDPAREYDETLHKAAGLLRALEQ
jgi:para-aminobenzoate synthetase component I